MTFDSSVMRTALFCASNLQGKVPQNSKLYSKAAHIRNLDDQMASADLSKSFQGIVQYLIEMPSRENEAWQFILGTYITVTPFVRMLLRYLHCHPRNRLIITLTKKADTNIYHSNQVVTLLSFLLQDTIATWTP